MCQTMEKKDLITDTPLTVGMAKDCIKYIHLKYPSLAPKKKAKKGKGKGKKGGGGGGDRCRWRRGRGRDTTRGEGGGGGGEGTGWAGGRRGLVRRKGVVCS